MGLNAPKESQHNQSEDALDYNISQHIGPLPYITQGEKVLVSRDQQLLTVGRHTPCETERLLTRSLPRLKDWEWNAEPSEMPGADQIYQHCLKWIEKACKVQQQYDTQKYGMQALYPKWEGPHTIVERCRNNLWFKDVWCNIKKVHVTHVKGNTLPEDTPVRQGH
ncbi:hypothetical protein PR048_004565 [Dryococelus australis]|uniref:Uncharacterized protein n=1 Tax=Dryococelus australis TaxID=614101 RepID=A0ABQ9I6S8_9NEOP|nr:hypothetical protein PR048_004565 [Dryococelus australis]